MAIFSFSSIVHRISNLAIICLNYIFSIIFAVNTGRTAIKVHVNKVQYNYGYNVCKYSMKIKERLKENIFAYEPTCFTFIS